MSLIIGFNVRDGIVVAGDRCTTIRENGITSHCFDSRKIVILNKRLVVLHCGDHFVTDNITAHEFLESCTDLITQDMDVTALPLAILSKYKTAGYRNDNIFLICGFDKNNDGFIYKVNVSKNSIEQTYGNKIFGGTWDGVYNIAAPILRSAKCDQISLLDAATLCKMAIETTGRSQLHCGIETTVSYTADIYVMHKSGNVKWFSGDAGFLVQEDQIKEEDILEETSYE